MPTKALPYDALTLDLRCSKCDRPCKNRSGLVMLQRVCRPAPPPAIKPTVTKLAANSPEIDVRIAEIAARAAANPAPPPSAYTQLGADLKPHERALRQHGGAPKVGR